VPLSPPSQEAPGGAEERLSVSVIVAVFNGAASIEPCIRSILDQDYLGERMELIVVDNASTDETAVILDRYKSDIRVLQVSRPGSAAARNAGIRAARGQLIALTDADCIVDRDWLTHLLPPLTDETVGIVGGRILARRPCNRIELFGERIHDHRRAIEEFIPPYAATGNWASRASVIHRVGLFDETLLRGQDVDLAYRMQQSGYRLVYSSEAKVYHLNERSFGGLFREGFVHGHHNLRVHRKHQAFLRYRPWTYMASILRRLGRNAVGCLRNPESFESLCAVVFESGKLVGHLTGELGRRFRSWRAERGRAVR
jgi:GT2 family glycosyltransferase